MLIGDANVGKSSLIPPWMREDYYRNEEEVLPTLKTVSRQKETTISGRKFLFTIWDTPGNETDESFEQNTSKCYKDADICVRFTITSYH